MIKLSASDFKSTCLDVLDRVASGAVDSVAVTKRGRVVGVLYPPAPSEPESVFGCMRGSVVIPADLDLTAPVADEEWDAQGGTLHR